MGYDIVIIGGGPAGLTAALYARRAGLSPIVLEQTVYGGQVANTPEVENYPGIPSISGVDLAMALYDQVAALGVEVRLEAPTGFRLEGGTKEILTAKGSYTAGAVIIAPATGPFSGGRRWPLWGAATPPWRTPSFWRETAPPST